MFSLIESRRALQDARVLDLFAGSGALALEALSRGAAYAVSVEHDRGCCAVIRRNAECIGLADRCEVRQAAVPAALRKLAAAGLRFDLVLLDPPYALEPWSVLESLQDLDLLAPEALVMVEHAAKAVAPERIGALVAIVAKRYGDTGVAIYAARDGADEPQPPT